jgi:hypothetical protein
MTVTQATFLMYAVVGGGAWLIAVALVLLRFRRLLYAAERRLTGQPSPPPPIAEAEAKPCAACKRMTCPSLAVVLCRDCFGRERGHGYRAGDEWFTSL